MARLEHRDGEEVAAVGPQVEMRERIDLFLGLAVDRAVRTDRKYSRVGAGEDVRESHPVIDDQKERQVGWRLCGLGRQVCGASEAG